MQFLQSTNFFLVFFREDVGKLDFVISLSTTAANNQSSFKVRSTLVKHVIYHCPITYRP